MYYRSSEQHGDLRRWRSSTLLDQFRSVQVITIQLFKVGSRSGELSWALSNGFTGALSSAAVIFLSVKVHLFLLNFTMNLVAGSNKFLGHVAITQQQVGDLKRALFWSLMFKTNLKWGDFGAVFDIFNSKVKLLIF